MMMREDKKTPHKISSEMKPILNKENGKEPSTKIIVHESKRCRLRNLGLITGHFPPGKYNAITDVPGVLVGHSSIIKGSGKLVRGKGPVRTGVTAILPNRGNIFIKRLLGGAFVINGAGEVSGLTQVMEWGVIETPILLTNTLSVGSCSQWLVKYMVDKYPEIGDQSDVIIPLVGECDDSWLNDIAGRHVQMENVYEAIGAAKSGPVQEGSVGGGTGMITCDFKGGIGTSSRKLPASKGGYIIGVLVMSNFGNMVDLRMDGIPVGQILVPKYARLKKRQANYGSIIAVAATDAPLLTSQINRLCKRVAIGIGRAGSHAENDSGEIVVGFSTANSVPRQPVELTQSLTILSDYHINPLYRAAVEATEEAILNSLCMAEDMQGINNHLCPALPLDEVRDIISRYKAPREYKRIPPPIRSGSDYAGPLDQVHSDTENL
ncbi:MAG: P1 family peptidase [Planctomycetota bacterium]